MAYEGINMNTKNTNRGFTLVEIMIVVAIIGLIVAIAVPSFLKSRRDAQGTNCSAQLEQIFSAQEQVSFKFNIPPGGAWPAAGAAATINTYLRGLDVSESCPSDGTYTLGGTVTDANGIVIVPTCTLENADPDGDGVVNSYEGLHVHRRSLRDNVRNPDLTFAT
jgi:general secretion pathway protein G